MKSSLKALVLISGLAAIAQPALAQNANWTGGASPDNSYSNPNNWGGTVPTATATVGKPATIILPGAATALSGDFAFTSGTITVDSSAFSFMTQTIQINGGAVVMLNLGTGTFTAVDNFIPAAVGNSSSFIGTNDGSGVLDISGTGRLDFASTTEGSAVGFGGTGTISQSSGLVTIEGLFGIGGDGNNVSPKPLGGAGGTGVYVISGGTLTANQLYVGNGSTTGGTTPTSGSLNINGGVVNASDLELGTGNSTGAVAIKTTTGAVNQTAGLLDTHLGTFDIGETSGGVGSYTLSGGTFTGNTVIVGDQANSSGTYTQNVQSGASTATVTTFTVAESGKGFAAFQSGQLTVNNGGSVNIGDNGTGVGTMTQSGGTLTMLATTNMNVGPLGMGTYNLEGGLLTDNTTSGITVGGGTGIGIFNMDGGTLTSNGSLTIGGGTGAGTFNYTGGTFTLPNGNMFIDTNGVFNQEHDLDTTGFVTGAISINGGTYNLVSGNLTIGGDITGGTSAITSAGTGTFNFGSGTVTTSSAFVDELPGALTGNTTFVTSAGNDATLTGAISGSGTFTVNGGGILDLRGSASSGATWSVDAGHNGLGGTASIDAGNFPSTGNMITEATGTIQVQENGNNVLSGSVTGAGDYNVNFGAAADSLELRGPVALTGVTTLTTAGGGNGTLQVLSGSFQDIGGPGGSLLVGDGTSTGTVNIHGTAGYAGNTTIDAGSTLLANNITSPGVVTDNGFLGSNIAIGAVPNTPTLNISGSYAASTGTLLIRMVSLGGGMANADQIAITGAANVAGTAFTLVNPQFTNGTYTILTSGALSGGGAIIQPTSNLFLNETIAPVGNTLVLTTITNTSATIPGLNLTPNEQAAASALDALIINNSGLSAGQSQQFSALLNAIGGPGTDPNQLAKYYEQLTPQSLQYAQAIAKEHATFLVTKVDGFDDALHHEFSGFDTSGVTIALPGFNSGLGRQMQSMLAYDGFHQAAPNGVNYYPGTDDTPTTSATIDESSSPSASRTISDSQTSAPMPMHTEPHSVVIRKPYSNFSAFIGGDGSIADLNNDRGITYAPSSKASYDAIDVIGGISYRMTSNLAAGVLFDYGHTDATTDDYGSKTKINTYSPGLFATYGDKGFFVNGLFAYGRNEYTNDRAVPVVDGVAHSTPSGNQYTAALDAGQELHLGGGFTLTPKGGLTYTHLDIDSFSESGAQPANLNVEAQHDDSLRSRLGGSLGYATYVGHIAFLPTLTAMWQHEFMDENAPITSSFNDFASGAFTIHSVSMGRDSALIGLGVTAELDNSMAIFLQANADLNGDYNVENFVGGFKGSF